MDNEELEVLKRSTRRLLATSSELADAIDLVVDLRGVRTHPEAMSPHAIATLQRALVEVARGTRAIHEAAAAMADKIDSLEIVDGRCIPQRDSEAQS